MKVINTFLKISHLKMARLDTGKISSDKILLVPAIQKLSANGQYRRKNFYKVLSMDGLLTPGY